MSHSWCGVSQWVSRVMKDLSHHTALRPHAKAIGALLATCKQRTLQYARDWKADGGSVSGQCDGVVPTLEMELMESGADFFETQIASCREWLGPSLSGAWSLEQVHELAELVKQVRLSSTSVLQK